MKFTSHIFQDSFTLLETMPVSVPVPLPLTCSLFTKGNHSLFHYNYYSWSSFVISLQLLQLEHCVNCHRIVFLSRWNTQPLQFVTSPGVPANATWHRMGLTAWNDNSNIKREHIYQCDCKTQTPSSNTWLWHFVGILSALLGFVRGIHRSQ